MKKRKKKKGIRISLGFKFTFFVTLLLTVILSAITVFIYNHESEVLSAEVKKRGSAIAKNLANNAAEALINRDELTLSLLAREAIQEQGAEEMKVDVIERIIDIVNNEILSKSKEEFLFTFSLKIEITSFISSLLKKSILLAIWHAIFLLRSSLSKPLPSKLVLNKIAISSSLSPESSSVSI